MKRDPDYKGNVASDSAPDVPIATKRNSVTRVSRGWYVVCASDELGSRPLARTVLGTPLAVFRGDNGSVGALLDRCPHRNVPLSAGDVCDGLLQCGYHGWRFDTEGECRRVPTLRGPANAQARRAQSFPCREADGFIWVWPDLSVLPETAPFQFELSAHPHYTTVRHTVRAQATLHATAENALDVPHTGFLHAGLFRADAERNRIEVVVRRWHDRVEAEYIGEPRPTGVVGRLLAPGGGVVEHFDRFILPSIVQVEYRLGESHLLVTAALTPVEDFLTDLHASISFRLPKPLPARALVPMLKPLALRIFRQDARVLAQQTANIRRFGGEHYVSTEVDVLGPQILRLLRAAERGALSPMATPAERRLEMEV